MHEYSLVQALLRQVEGLMREQQAQRVATIKVSVGDFSGVEPELFQLAFETLVDDTPARGADLKLERVALESKCRDCGREFEIDRFRFQCPHCASGDLMILRGEELVLESVTLEQDEA